MTPVDNLWISLWIIGFFLWISLWISCGKTATLVRLWITRQLSTGYPQAIPIFPQGFSTSGFRLQTAFLGCYPHIHSPYYYYDYPYLNVLKINLAVKEEGG